MRNTASLLLGYLAVSGVCKERQALKIEKWQDSMRQPLPPRRTEFGTHVTVFCWPTTGGLWVLPQANGIQLNFLNVSRIEPAPSQRYSQAEDDFCQRVEWIGGKYFTSESEYHNQIGEHGPLRIDEWLGWPGAVPDDGLWVLRELEVTAYDKGLGLIETALTMQERCTAIEWLGGKFYETWDEYNDMLLHLPHAKGRHELKGHQ